MDQYGGIDSKFRYVIVAAKRAKQLLRGAKPKMDLKTRNPIRIAQIEVQSGLVEYEILQNLKEDVIDDASLIHAGDVDEIDDGGAGVAHEEETIEEAILETEDEGNFEDDLPEVELVEDKDDN